ncbi:MAG: presenilin family intramembrane aspartyl protease, partial [Conexivisphaerales archaeon]
GPKYFSNAFFAMRAILIFLLLSIFIDAIISLIVALVLIYYEKRLTILANINNILISSFLAATIGVTLGLVGAEILLAIIALYDFISVYITKHMLTLVKAFKNQPQNAGIVLTGKKYRNRMFLGNGDLVFSNILVSASFFALRSLSFPILEEALAFAGLFIILMLGKKKKGYPVMAYVGPLQIAITNLILYLII